MPAYRRAYVPGGCYFFTVVIEQRQPVLTHADVRVALVGGALAAMAV